MWNKYTQLKSMKLEQFLNTLGLLILFNREQPDLLNLVFSDKYLSNLVNEFVKNS